MSETFKPILGAYYFKPNSAYRLFQINVPCLAKGATEYLYEGGSTKKSVFAKRGCYYRISSNKVLSDFIALKEFFSLLSAT